MNNHGKLDKRGYVPYKHFAFYGKRANIEKAQQREVDIFYGRTKPTLMERVLGEIVHALNRPPRKRYPRTRYILLR